MNSDQLPYCPPPPLSLSLPETSVSSSKYCFFLCFFLHLVLVCFIERRTSQNLIVSSTYSILSWIEMPGQGSTIRKCVVCHQQINVACKTCRSCQGEQPHKLRLKKKLDKFDQKRESWVHAQKKNRTTSHLQDEAYMLVCNCF